jgi:hypothetical protein
MVNSPIKLIPREIRETGFPTADFLSEEQQQIYEEACKGFKNEKARSSLKVSRNGSNLFKVLLLNQIGIRTATLSELESALENGMDLRGCYEDAPAVVLRSAEDSYSPNDYLAKNLTKQLEVKEFKVPLVVEGLKVVEDDNSQYGLRFERTDLTKVTEAPDLNHQNNLRKFSRINPNYSIDFNGEGTRNLYTRSSGVSRLYLYGDLCLSSDNESLADSGDTGRVVVVNDAEGVSQNFLGDYLTSLQQEKDRQISDIEDKYARAKAILKGK